MILPESLHPSLTRDRFQEGRRKQVKNLIARTALSDFVSTEDGLWLPPYSVSAEEFTLGREAVGIIWSRKNKDIVVSRQIAGLLDLESESGCWSAYVGDLDIDNIDVINELASDVLSGTPLDTDQELIDLRLCDSKQCVYPRHYDITYACESQRREKTHIDPRFYDVLPSGEIQMIWGDILPPIGESIAELRKLQKACPPYADQKTSPLTAHGISQITMHPITGCWEVRSFYTRPPGIRPGYYQYDGYGRLGMRSRTANGLKGMPKLAHRVTWQATGRKLRNDRDLNHRCAHRPCANPLHLEQVTRRANILHSGQMQDAISSLL